MHSSDPGVGEAEGGDSARALVQLWGLAAVPQPASHQGETADKLQSVCNAVARGACTVFQAEENMAAAAFAPSSPCTRYLLR